MQRFFENGSKAGIQPKHATRLRLQLGPLDADTGPEDMNLAGWRLHPLKGHLGGHWAVWVDEDWRLTFRFSVSRVALSRVVNGRAAVSAELSIRLAAAPGGSAESWLRMQVADDLWQAQKRRRPKIRRLKMADAVYPGIGG